MRDGSRLGFGGAPLGNMYSAIRDSDAAALLDRVYQDGCRTFDTAPHYGNGRSEQRFGRLMRNVPRDSVTLSTKVGRVLEAHPDAPHNVGPYIDVLPYVQHFDYSAAGVRRSVEDSLRRLGVERIDVAYVHDCSTMIHGDRTPSIVCQVIDESVPELHRMRDEGMIDRVGVAVSDWQVCVQILREVDLDCLLLAGRYTLLDQGALPELLPLCEARGVAIALGGVFNSGILAVGVKNTKETLRFNYEPADSFWVARAAKLENICERFRVPLRAAALQFVLAQPVIEIVLIGAKTYDHWHDALIKAHHPIPGDFWQALREENLIPHAVPTPQ